jgi:hypothetical protein
VQHFITAMDSLKLNLVAVDQVNGARPWATMGQLLTNSSMPEPWQAHQCLLAKGVWCPQVMLRHCSRTH